MGRDLFRLIRGTDDNKITCPPQNRPWAGHHPPSNAAGAHRASPSFLPRERLTGPLPGFPLVACGCGRICQPQTTTWSAWSIALRHHALQGVRRLIHIAVQTFIVTALGQSFRSPECTIRENVTSVHCEMAASHTDSTIKSEPCTMKVSLRCSFIPRNIVQFLRLHTLYSGGT